MNLPKLHKKKGRDKSRDLSLIAESRIIERRLCTSSRESSPANLRLTSPRWLLLVLQRGSRAGRDAVIHAAAKFSALLDNPPFGAGSVFISFSKISSASLHEFAVAAVTAVFFFFFLFLTLNPERRRSHVHPAMRIVPYSARLNKASGILQQFSMLRSHECNSLLFFRSFR